MILVTKPYIPNEKKLFKLLREANKREWLTNFGPLHNELTEKLEDYLGVKNLLLVSNGTLALQVAFRALGLKDKVITSPFSFVATSSALVWEGLKPQFIDIEKKSLGINPKLLPEKPSKTSGIVAVHVYGNPSDTKALDKYCKDHKLKMIYDGAHAFGIKEKGKSVLLAGDATTLSLHATKVFHTVEGGAIIFKKKEDFELAKQLVNFGYDDRKDIRSVGINSKLNEYQAAVGLVLLEEIDEIIERRTSILNRYYDELKDYVEILDWKKNVTMNGAYAPIFLKNEEKLIFMQKSLNEDGIQTRRYFHPSLNEVPEYSRNQKCPISEDLAKRVLCLPIYTSMTSKEQNQVIKNVIRRLK